MFIIENKRKEELGRYETMKEAKKAFKGRRFSKLHFVKATDTTTDVYIGKRYNGRIREA